MAEAGRESTVFFTNSLVYSSLTFMSFVSGWRVAGALIGCDEIVVCVLSDGCAVGLFTGWLSTGLITLSRSCADVSNAAALNKTHNTGTSRINFVKTYFSVCAAIQKVKQKSYRSCRPEVQIIRLIFFLRVANRLSKPAGKLLILVPSLLAKPEDTISRTNNATVENSRKKVLRWGGCLRAAKTVEFSNHGPFRLSATPPEHRSLLPIERKQALCLRKGLLFTPAFQSFSCPSYALGKVQSVRPSKKIDLNSKQNGPGRSQAN